MSDEWDGEDRRKRQDIPAPMREMMITIATQAFHGAARTHRIKVAIWCFAAGFLSSLAIALPVSLDESHNNRVAATNNSHFNCAMLTSVADLFSKFLLSDANLRYKQTNYNHKQEVLSAFSAFIRPKLIQEIQASSDAADRHSRRFWAYRLAPAMRQLASVNCKASLNGNRTAPVIKLPRRK